MTDILDRKIIWHEVLESIRVSVSPAIYRTWFAQTYLADIRNDNDRISVNIGCSSPFIKTTIENRYFGMIQDLLMKTLEKECDINFLVKQDPDKLIQTKTSPSPLFDQDTSDQKENYKEAAQKARIRSTFIFENFAVSSSNQMAHAAAEAVARTPGEAYNPLFIYGGVGVGKTHLMFAVGNYMLASNLNSKILFCTGEDFTNEIIQGIRNKNMQAVRDRFRRLELLLVDDIQFIAGKDTVQEEFFHTFNAVTTAGGQVILTSDKPPSEISKLEERLKSRFEAGLIVDISPPDFELRCAILEIKTRERGITLDSDLIQLIAGNVESARKLEGVLTRILSEARLKNTPITEDMIQTILGKADDMNGAMLAKKTPTDVIDAVSKYFSLGKRALLGESRSKPIVVPRQILMYILKTQLGLPFQEVGRLIGGRDHTTVMHAVDKITHLASSDVQIRQDIRGIKSNL